MLTDFHAIYFYVYQVIKIFFIYCITLCRWQEFNKLSLKLSSFPTSDIFCKDYLVITLI